VSFRCRLVTFLTLFVVCASALGAQDNPARVSLDGSVGAARGWGSG